MRNGWRVGLVAVMVLAVGGMWVGAQEKAATYFLVSVPEVAALRVPLASAEDVRAFELANGQMIVAAKKGWRENRAAAAEVMRRRSEDKNYSAGVRRLLAVNAFELAARGGLSFPEIEGYAERAWAVLEGNSIEVVARRVGIMEMMVGLSSGEPRDSYTNIGQAYFELAEMRMQVGEIDEALRDVDMGMDWIVDEQAFLNKVRPQAEALREELRRRKATGG